MKTLITILLLAFSLSAFSQNVGINTPTPAQKLDVNGKIVLSDDATTPTEGAIRYNATTNEHEGFNGTQWVSFSAKKSSGLPTNPKPIHGFGVFGNNGSSSSINMFLDDGSAGFSSVPTGKYVIITLVSVESNNLGSTGRAYFRIGPSSTINTSPNFTRSMTYFGDRINPQIFNNGGGAPLVTLRPSEYLSAFNDSNSDYGVNVRFRGFLVDDLNY